MVEFKELYLRYIEHRGVGSNDQVADSRRSYVSYLNTVSKLVGEAVSPDLLRSYGDVENIARRIAGQKSPSSIDKYRSAMRRYVEMVHDEGL